jgi:predicted secreted protein
MGFTSAIVLFVMIWSMCFLIAIPIRLQTQSESGEVVPGTHGSSPQVHHLKEKALIVTVVSCVLWALAAWIIITGQITVRDLDIFNRMGPPATSGPE